MRTDAPREAAPLRLVNALSVSFPAGDFGPRNGVFSDFGLDDSGTFHMEHSAHRVDHALQQVVLTAAHSALLPMRLSRGEGDKNCHR